MSDFKTFVYSVSASLIAGLIVMNMDKIMEYIPRRSSRKIKPMPQRRMKELKRSKPTSQKHRLARR